ncbi:DNA polymerase III subunit beta [Mesorhizobium sp. KR2-14]|uniref:DNA polymerase III subunit beta n=1 Tax=Mesorhizobium sp. KR2-14 TaxID=3156610 RepID=UPI0032B329AC
MTIALDPKVLAAVHAALKSIPDRRNVIPVAGMFHLEPGASGLTVTATDCDIEAALTVDCAASFEPVCLPPYLVEAAAGLGVAEVKIAIDERQAVVTGGKARFKAPILPGSDFPKFKQTFDGHFEIAGEALARIIQATVDAASGQGDDHRYYLEGVFLQTLDGRLQAVATNGHRMHAASAEFSGRQTLQGDGIIVPTKAANEIAKLASKAGGRAVTVETSRGAISVRAGGERIASKLIDGSYPAWQRVVPSPSEITATFDLAEMVAALDRVMKIQSVNEAEVKAKSRAGSVRLSEDGDTLTIATAGHQSGGEAVDAVRAEFNGDWGARGVSSRYLRATLAAMKDRGRDTATIDVADPGSPMRIESPTDDDFVAVVMPMRV